jgi:phosphatidylserine/phosphatidylglycerophosphate/cardiolipin synthase-like enzyme
MKKFKFFIAVCILLFARVYGMAPSHPLGRPVQVYFVPENQVAMNRELVALLDNARRQVLIAMYWITEDSIIDKLIALKRKGIDVHLIFDESSNESINLINRLLHNSILPVIFPSKSMLGIGFMHNKFLVIDNAIVWTGSANFTKTAINSENRFSNHENVIILHSEDIAQKFTQAFFNIEKHTFNLYIMFIANNAAEFLPRWINQLVPLLYQINPRLQSLLGEVFVEFTPFQKDQINKFFKDMRPWEPITAKQKAFLEFRGISTGNMSKERAFKLIESIKQQEIPCPYPG